jgi:EpsG family
MFYYSFLLLISLSVYVGLRVEMGSDWSGYTNIFWSVSRLDWDDLFSQSEPGFFVINKLSEEVGFDLQGVMVVRAFLFLFDLITFAATIEEPWLALPMAATSATGKDRLRCTFPLCRGWCIRHRSRRSPLAGKS